MVIRYAVFERVARFPRRVGCVATPSRLQSSQRKGWLLARSEALAAAHRAMNALAPSEDMVSRIGAELGLGQVQPRRVLSDLLLSDLLARLLFGGYNKAFRSQEEKAL